MFFNSQTKNLTIIHDHVSKFSAHKDCSQLFCFLHNECVVREEQAVRGQLVTHISAEEEKKRTSDGIAVFWGETTPPGKPHASMRTPIFETDNSQT